MSELKEESELGSRQGTLLTFLRSSGAPSQAVGSSSSAALTSAAQTGAAQTSASGSSASNGSLSYSCPVCGLPYRDEINMNSVPSATVLNQQCFGSGFRGHPDSEYGSRGLKRNFIVADPAKLY